MNIWVGIYRTAWGVLIAIFAVVVVCAFAPKCHRLQHLQASRIRIEQENLAIEAQTRELRSKRERLQSDPYFVERTAREMHMAKPAETVFRAEADANSTNGLITYEQK